MNPQNINQEILLFTGTSFASRKFCSPGAEDKKGKYTSPHDILEKTNWDGLLGELLPEVAHIADSKRERFIWQIVSADNFLCINSSTCDIPVLGESSLDPYYFITSVNFN